MIVGRQRRELVDAMGGYSGEQVAGAHLGRMADGVAWSGAYRHRACALLQVPHSILDMDEPPPGIDETHRLVWIAEPLASHYTVRFAYQATTHAASASERTHLDDGIWVRATLREHVGGAVVDGVPAVEWAESAGTLEPRTVGLVRVFGESHFPGLDSFPVGWATSTGRIDLAPAAFPSRPRALNALGEAGTQLRLELEARNVRIVAARVFYAGL